MAEGSLKITGTKNLQRKETYKNEFEFIEDLLTIAATEKGDTGVPHHEQNFDWVDQSLISEGWKFYKKHFSVLSLSSGLTSVFGMSLKSIISTVSRTGNIDSFDRVVHTTKFFFQNMHRDLLDLKGAGAQEILKIRKIHEKVAVDVAKKKLPEFPPLKKKNRRLFAAVKSDWSEFPNSRLTKDDLKAVLTYEPDVAMSALDSVLTQFTTMGLVVGYPELFGLNEKNVNSRGFQGYIQNFGIITQLLGVDDRWNICRQKFLPAPIVFRRVWEDIMIGALQQLDIYGFQVGVLFSYKYISPTLFFYGLSRLAGLDGNESRKVLNKREIVLSKIIDKLVASHRNSRCFQKISAAAIRTGLMVIFQTFRRNV